MLKEADAVAKNYTQKCVAANAENEAVKPLTALTLCKNVVVRTILCSGLSKGGVDLHHAGGVNCTDILPYHVTLLQCGNLNHDFQAF